MLFFFLIGLLLAGIAAVIRLTDRLSKWRFMVRTGMILVLVFATFIQFLPIFIFPKSIDDDLFVTLYSEVTGPIMISGSQKDQCVDYLRATKFRRDLFHNYNLSGNETYYHAILYDGHQHYSLNLYVSTDGSIQLLQMDTDEFGFRQLYIATNPELLSQYIIHVIQESLP